MIEIFFGALGLIVGSFLNVLILRGGVRSLGGRSECMSCARKIAWYDLIPVLSWVGLRGRCRYCKAKIAVQYPLVEMGTALLFVLVGMSPLPLFSRLLGLPIAAVLIAIAVYDLRHTIIPDSWVWTFNALAFFYSLFTIHYSLFTFLSGPIAALPLFILWFVSSGRWMGLGDAKLALGIGWLLGPLYGFISVFLAFVIGAIVSLPLLFFSSKLWQEIIGSTRTPSAPLSLFFRIYQRVSCIFFRDKNEALIHNLDQKTKAHLVSGFTMKSEVPFGPFLVASCFIMWLALMYDIPIPLP